MKKILCATRGGEASRRTQDAVIAMAKEAGASVLFLFVVDVEFLKLVSQGVRPDIVSTELDHMGAFLLALACERAAAQGVEAETLIRHGSMPETLISVALEQGVDAVVLGQPAGSESAFTVFELKRLAARIEGTTGIKTYVI